MRNLFALTPMAKERSYTAGKFSFNKGDGRCPTCGGSGFEHVEMQFLSDVYLRCPDCDGKRYRAEMLEVTIERKAVGDLKPRLLNVSDVLDLTVGEAIALFSAGPRGGAFPAAHRGRGPGVPEAGPAGAHAVGRRGAAPQARGFPGQGQQDHQRQQAGAGLRQPGRGTLFLFDEPTTGLHFDDIAKLMRALRKLLEAGHSLIVIEHNLDVIRSADWLIDLGPEGGEAGGLVVAPGHARGGAPASHARTPALALREYEQAMGKVHGGAKSRAPKRAGHAAGASRNS